MKLGTKILLAALGAVALAITISLFVQRHTLRANSIAEIRKTMQATILSAESLRSNISRLNNENAFNQEALLAQFRQSGDLAHSGIYQTIPVVAAWQSIEEVAKKYEYEFRIPKHEARNSKNLPRPEEEAILKDFDAGAEEFFEWDFAKNSVTYARPIVLSSDCLKCHGDPKNSPTGDGKDILGYKMEGWKTGEVRGAFLLRSKLDSVNAHVREGMLNTLAWVCPAVLVIALGFIFLNRRAITLPLQRAFSLIEESANTVSAASSQTSASSQSLAEGASEQAASLEETSASLEEMASMTRRSAENAQSAKELANQARIAADTGASDMARMDSAMLEIKQAGDNIAKIIKTIDEIAFQTNILALNAAVEAARAGEAGMGFAVVADEVRSLAQRSAQAAKETAEKIEDCIRKSEAGVAISSKVGTSLNEILSKATQVDELVAEIATASREQSQGIDQVNTALTQMDKVTQNNAASAEESASAAEELNAQAQALKNAVGDLQTLVQGEASTKVSSPEIVHTAHSLASAPVESPVQGRMTHVRYETPIPQRMSFR